MAVKPQFHFDIRASFATALSNWRRKNRIPLKKIARDLGVSISTVSAWEWGEYFPTGSNLEILVGYTGLPPCKLFCLMADKCVPGECLLAIRQIGRRRARSGPLAPSSAVTLLRERAERSAW